MSSLFLKLMSEFLSLESERFTQCYSSDFLLGKWKHRRMRKTRKGGVKGGG